MPDKPLCIIPARGGSKRFARKNLALLDGKPLLAYAIEAAAESGVFDLVCVSSEDQEILDVASAHGAGLALKRPPELAGDTAQVKHVCEYLLADFAQRGQRYAEFGVVLATNPLRTAEDIRQAYALLKGEGVNYVMSLVPFSHPPQRAVRVADGYATPYLGLQHMRPGQALEPLYRHDGSIVFAKTAAFLKEREFYGSNVAPYFVPADRSVDIDSPLDLAWAQFLLMSRTGAGR